MERARALVRAAAALRGWLLAPTAGGGRGVRPLRGADHVLPRRSATRSTRRWIRCVTALTGVPRRGRRPAGRAFPGTPPRPRSYPNVRRRRRHRPATLVPTPGAHHAGHHHLSPPARPRCPAPPGPASWPRSSSASWTRQSTHAAVDRRRELHLAGRAGRARLAAGQQVRGGLSGRPLPRRLRDRRRRRADRRASGPGSSSAPTTPMCSPHSGSSAVLAGLRRPSAAR